jgi:hypothetical protein
VFLEKRQDVIGFGDLFITVSFPQLRYELIRCLYAYIIASLRYPAVLEKIPIMLLNKYQKAKIKIVELPLCGNDILNFDICILVFNFPMVPAFIEISSR